MLPKRADNAEGQHPLTDYLIEVDGPLKQLSGEWEATFAAWRDAGRHVPPVMIVVTNETKMAEILDRLVVTPSLAATPPA